MQELYANVQIKKMNYIGNLWVMEKMYRLKVDE